MALSLSLGERLAARLQRRVFSAFLRQAGPWYDGTPAGAMASTLGADVDLVQAAVTRLLGARVRPPSPATVSDLNESRRRRDAC